MKDITRIVAGLVLAFVGCVFQAARAQPETAPQTASTPGSAAASELDLLANIRQLTFEGKRSGEGYFSPEGTALIFQSEREPGNPFYQIYILDLKTGENHRVSPGIGKTTCGFFRPGSQEVLFASTHHDPDAKAKQQAELDFRASGKQRRYSWDYDEQMDIFVAARDGSALRRLTEAPGYDAEAAFSPDGQKIVFTSLRSAYSLTALTQEDQKRLETDPAHFGEIYIMNADGSNPQRLTTSPGYDGGPFFSPDGQRIVWRRFAPGGVVADVLTMRLDGTDVRQITDFGCMSWAPFFHPTGQYIVLTANKLGFANFELFIADAAGEREPVRVSYADGFDGLPSFSPDGKRLCWTSTRTSDGTSQLFLADWDHAAALAKLSAAPARNAPSAPAHEVVANPNVPTRVPGASEKSYSAEITTEDLQRDVAYLASESLAGRMTGSKGAQEAAQFIADRLRNAGAKPFERLGGYFQEFEFNAGVQVLTNENRLALIQPNATAPLPFQPEQDFRPMSFTSTGEAEGELVFAGYGLSLPGKPGEGYNSYAGLDVTNKIVLVLRYVPENVDPKRRQELNRYAAPRYKAMIAREHGAKAILMVTGPNSPNAGELLPLSFDSSVAASGILAASISGKTATALLTSLGKDLATLQTELDAENPHTPGGLAVPKVRVRIATAVQHVKRSDQNVVGYLPPSEGGNSYVLVGAHYDHLGHGETGAMLRQGEEGLIHPGADDNASGVAAVLELAEALHADSAKHPAAARRGVIFGLWSGEELGLIGSTHFANQPPVELSNIVGYVNFDMVGRLRDNRLMLQGVGSSPAWRRLIEKRNVPAGFNLTLQDDPYLPTDVTAFYPKQVPVLNFFTGSHEEYHRPTDRPDTINHAGLERISKFARGLIGDLITLSNQVDYAKVERSSGAGGQRDNLRAYLGTIPDYTSEMAGVKLSGVRAGSPAERAGIKPGDVIVEFAHQQIKNIYDYTYALDAVKIGQPTDIVVMRGTERQTVRVIPEARK